MTNRRVITIDGWAASGKSSIAKAVAERLGWKHLNTGMLYRGIAWLADQENSFESLSDLVKNHKIEFVFNAQADIIIDGISISEKLYSESISKLASVVAKDQELRDLIIPHQRNAFLGHNLVAEGRDMGTVIFPDAENKFFVEASVDVRARRRALQLSNDSMEQEKIFNSVREELILRDERDKVRTFPADGAIIINNSTRSLSEIVDEILKKVKLY